jgi:phosphoribosylamine--glycine ligase
LRGAREDGLEIRGVLFLGLMMTPTRGAQVLEYNVRFGDPETQSILIRLETDLLEICDAIENQTLDKLEIKWKKGSSACVVLAARNYPANPQTADLITGLDKIKSNENTVVFHSGTAKNETGGFITTGGRVLGVTATGDDLDEALRWAYDAVNLISFNGMQFRRDIGKT